MSTMAKFGGFIIVRVFDGYMNYFIEFREEYSFSSVKRLVEGSKSHLADGFGVSESDLSESESSILSGLSWGDLERKDGRGEWVTFSYDDTTVKVYVYADYDVPERTLNHTSVRFVLRESKNTCQFRVLPDGSIQSR
jgi:hypothetical protein